VQGWNQDLGLGEGGKSRIEAPKAPRVCGVAYDEGVRTGLKRGSAFFGLEIRIFLHSPAHLSICFCTVIRPGPHLQIVQNACPV